MAIDYDDPAVIQEAKDKLAEMYSKADRSGRVAIGRGLGYDKAGTNPDSARRCGFLTGPRNVTSR